MSQDEPNVNTTIESKFLVQSSDLASSISPEAGDQFPAVFATSRLVAFMEITCARLLQQYLGAGQLSVGVEIDVSHTAPTPDNATVTMQAKFVGKEGKLFMFEVIASDPAGEIGRAKHSRAIIDSKRLQEGASRRIKVSQAIGKALLEREDEAAT
jgi:fluoroacetyl-CoA thioesterase